MGVPITPQDVESIDAGFGYYLKRLRVRRGWSVSDVVMKTGIQHPRLIYIESSRNRGLPCPWIMSALARCYSVPVTQLLTFAGYNLKEDEGEGKCVKESD